MKPDTSKYHTVQKSYSLAAAFGPEFPDNKHVTGFEPSHCRFVPRPDPYFRWDRTLLRDLIIWWEEGRTSDAALLFGPTGSGKSSGIRNFCAALHIPMYGKTLHQSVEFEELVSVVDLNDFSTVTSYSYLPLAMGAEGWPGIFVANELDRADPGTVIGLNEVLEGQPLMVHLGGLEPVDPAPQFRIVATGNSALCGDTVGSYVSVREQDMALADRYWTYYVPYPEPGFEEHILAAAAPKLPQLLRTKMIEVANDIRAAFMGESASAGALPLTMSTRSLVRWARMTYYFRGAESASVNVVGYALDRALLHRAKGKPEVRKAVLKIVKGRMGDSVGALE